MILGERRQSENQRDHRNCFGEVRKAVMKKARSQTLRISVTQNEHLGGQNTRSRSCREGPVAKRLTQFWARCFNREIGCGKIGKECEREQPQGKRERIEPIEHVRV